MVDYKELLRDRRIIILLITLLVALLLVAFRGIHYGIEFVGGVRIPVTLEKKVDPSQMNDIINTIKLRVTKFGLSQVNVKGIGESEIYVEIPQGDASQIQEIEKILKQQGKYEGIVDGQVAITGEDFLAGSIKDAELTTQGDTVQWRVSFAISQDAARTFSKVVLGKANYPVYMFLDRYEDAIILIKKDDLLGEGISATEDEALKVLRNAVKRGNDTIPIFLVDDFKSIKTQLQALNSTKKRVILSQDTEKGIIDELTAMNYSIVNKTADDMKPKLRSSQGELTLSQWGAANLLSAPVLSPDITTGRINQFYEINGYAPQTLSFDAKKTYALNEGRRLRSILSGGALPVQIIIGTATSIPPYLGEEFLRVSLIGSVISASVVSFIIFLRYKNLKIVLPIILTIFLEMSLTLIVVGAFGTIDLGVMAGAIGTVGTGVNDQIVITDEILGAGDEKKKPEVKVGLSRAFFIVILGALISVVSMIPLLFFSGLVEIIGFALSVIIGVIIGAAITRPAFGAVMERVAR
jgi:preprotein translocase subunit SecD